MLALIISVPLGILCLVGACLTDDQLVGLSNVIGTSNPKTARIFCIIGVIVFLGAAVGGLLSASAN